MIWIIVIAIAGLLFILAAMYQVVSPSEAHLVVTPRKRLVCSPDPNIQANGGGNWYFRIPILRKVRMMDLTIKELVVKQETYEMNQARYMVRSSTKYRIRDVQKASETFISDAELKEQLTEVIVAAVRAVTVKYDVVNARAKKSLMSKEVHEEIKDDLSAWGLNLESFQLVDFQDTEDSTIISDISKRREVEIQATTREQNAEKNKQARMKEAEADEKAQEREIERNKIVGERQQQAKQAISEKEKLAREKELEVTRVEQVMKQQIEKERAQVQAEQEREVEKVQKEQKKLKGEGDRLMQEEQAKGMAAPIREKGFAEADAKEKLQAALNKFKDEAIRALVAEQIVAMQRDVGIAGAKALEAADLKIFSGGDGAKNGFDLGALISSVSVANESAAEAVSNRIARPNDLGLAALGLSAKQLKDAKKKKSSEPIVVPNNDSDSKRKKA